MSSTATPSSTTTTLRSLFADVIHGGRVGDWRRSLNAANKILQISPGDSKAFHCKVVCLVHLSQFQEVISLCKKNDALAKSVQFERAYSLYRLNRPLDALDVLDSGTACDPTDEKVKELKAQVLYRLERCEECREVYKDLIRNTQDEYGDERETNLSAVLAHLHSRSTNANTALETLRDETYELAYNAACSLIAQKQFETALKKLVIAEELCKKSLEEDGATEDEVDDELGIIRVQRAYAIQMMGDVDKAAQLYTQVLKQKPSDVTLTAVASNNVVAINGDQNIFDSKKKMKAVTASEIESKLTNRQRAVVALNQCLLLVHANQFVQCRELLENLKRQSPDSAEVVLVEAALHCREKNERLAIDVLKKFLENHPKDVPPIAFALVEILLSQGMEREACDVLNSLGAVSQKPGVVSALISLYLHLDDKESATRLFRETLDWYKINDPKSEHRVVLWRSSAKFHMDNGNAEAAAESLEQLRRMYPKDVKILAQLITAYSQFDAKKAVLASKALPSVDDVLHKSVDVDSLESMAFTSSTKYLKKVTKTEAATPSVIQSTESDQLLVKRKSKKKKGKLPKNYDPSRTPDPERWIPRRDRAAYKKRKERNPRGAAAASSSIGKGTQGSTVANADMDVSAKPAAGPQPRMNATSAASSSPGDRGGRSERPLQALKKSQKKKPSGKW